MPEENLIIRADASTQIGSGHFMRCLALAQAWKDAGGEVIFITACQNEGLLQRLKVEDFKVYVLACSHPDPIDWNYTREILAAYPDAWVVLDSYHFNEEYQEWVKEAGRQLLVVDDMAHLKHYYADILLNQNLHAEQLDYSCEPYTCLLLGIDYALLRREFLAWKEWRREIPEVARHVLVTLGGADPENYTLKVLQALQRADVLNLEAIAVIGANNPHANLLEAAIRKNRIPVRLIHDVKNMPELMAWADVAVSSAGTTVWELAFMGVPTIVGIIAPIEEFLVYGLKKQGLFLNIGWFDSVSVTQVVEALKKLVYDERERNAMSVLGTHLLDGDGCDRILRHIKQERS
ncbi:MAG: UDP-2,4-diacetamido-2,4,6-trideoxy-beta-L-altropyranose hydrolase [Actinobacteria bacterium]|nr:UDP-2,4-diacetamido-2,4,6-trideoxy-beta-L-altropyranose hydrolase [Actinomycetota bacterium]MBU4401594.1 UDP-2,4-diacetamido-2,4,6-trideoxy-beta-L-altropyranose hydrolase [Actinomycetota bacterium]MCG2820045.1 UDP-2,4-diacetamido-2,4,6-trideoxy-beta-L-altropyranose hydrolase [Actinomycetes bacterium]